MGWMWWFGCNLFYVDFMDFMCLKLGKPKLAPPTAAFPCFSYAFPFGPWHILTHFDTLRPAQDADACPSACDDDVGCCLDWVAAGEAIAVTSLAEAGQSADAGVDSSRIKWLQISSIFFRCFFFIFIPGSGWWMDSDSPIRR